MKKIIILVGLITAVNINTSGQSNNLKSKILHDDTLKDHAISEKRNYLDANFMEESSLIKLGVSPFQFSMSNEKLFYSQIYSILTFEKKLSPAWSIISNLNMIYRGDFSTDWESWYFSNDIGVRYYYTMNKRIRNSSGANNFNSNYFSIVVKNWGECRLNKVAKGSYNKDWNFAPDYLLSWGIQRRFGKWGFVDLGSYLSYTRDLRETPTARSLGFGFNFKFGLAYGWK